MIGTLGKGFGISAVALSTFIAWSRAVALHGTRGLHATALNLRIALASGNPYIQVFHRTRAGCGFNLRVRVRVDVSAMAGTRTRTRDVGLSHVTMYPLVIASPLGRNPNKLGPPRICAVRPSSFAHGCCMLHVSFVSTRRVAGSTAGVGEENLPAGGARSPSCHSTIDVGGVPYQDMVRSAHCTHRLLSPPM